MFTPVLVICRYMSQHDGIVPVMALITETDKYIYPPPVIVRDKIASTRRLRFFHSTCRECRKAGLP